MDKNETLESIKDAIKSHESQMLKIESAINGHNIEDPTVISKTECVFGLWLYDDTNNIRAILGTQFFDKIEALHAQWHIEYAKIFAIFFKEKKKGFFEKILNTNRKVDDMELDKAKLYFENLLEITQELLKILSASERRVDAMSENKFN